MLFSSPTFLFFFLPASLILYFATPTRRLKSLVLILLSLAFYAWGEPWFVGVLVGSIVFNYFAALFIEGQQGGARKLALGAALGGNLAVLALFKYAAFAARSFNAVAAPANMAVSVPNLVLPLGISFFTFHGLSYVIDVYRGRATANRRLEEIALYIAFFPQLVAGPIVRYNAIARRLRVRRHSFGRASAGLRIFIIGLAQKVLIADQLAPLAGALFDHVRKPGLGEAWTGTLAYSLQIYFDFAGYSNMAIGLGIVFGFSLPRNFNLPYRARSVTEFWRRWHISLTRWFRDYLYVPMGGNRGGRWRTCRNLLIVFLLCGLWHGASWTFVLWGLWHGAFLAAERMGLRKGLVGVGAIAGWAYAMLAVMGGWVLFRSPDLTAALSVWSGLVGLNGTGAFGPELKGAFEPLHVGALVTASVLAVMPFVSRRGRSAGPARRLVSAVRTRIRPAGALGTLLDTGAVAVLLILALVALSGGTYPPFLYFRF